MHSPVTTTLPNDLIEEMRKRCQSLNIPISTLIAYGIRSMLARTDAELQALEPATRGRSAQRMKALPLPQAMILDALKDGKTTMETEIARRTMLGPGALARALFILKNEGKIFDLGLINNPAKNKGAPLRVRMWSINDPDWLEKLANP